MAFYVGVWFALSLTACGGGGGGGSSSGSSGGGGSTPTDTTKPVLTFPTAQVAANGTIVVSANENINGAGLSIVVTYGSTTVAGTTTLGAGNTVVFTPTNPFPFSATLNVTATASDTSGNVGTVTGTVTTAASTVTFNKVAVAGVTGITLIDTATNGVQTLSAIDGNGCFGTAFKKQTTKLRVYCAIASAGHYFWDVDPLTGAATPVSNPFISFAGVTKAMVAIGADGREYYTAGFATSATGSNARIVVLGTDGKQLLAEIPLSTNSSVGDYILRMWLDESAGKLWIASRGGILDRIDLATLKTDLTINSINAAISGLVDMKVTASNVIITVLRTASGADALVFDKNTGVKVKEIALPIGGTTGSGLSYGITLTSSDLLIASPGGYYRVNPTTFVVGTFAPVFTIGTSDDLVFANGKIYGNNANDVYVFPTTLLSSTKVLTVNGAQRITAVSN